MSHSFHTIGLSCICKMDILESLRISLPSRIGWTHGIGLHLFSGSLEMIICPSMPLKVQWTAGEKEK